MRAAGFRHFFIKGKYNGNQNEKLQKNRSYYHLFRSCCSYMTQATVSYHLSILKSADLVREEKDKNYIYYEINATVFEEMLLYFKSFLGGNDDVEE